MSIDVRRADGQRHIEMWESRYVWRKTYLSARRLANLIDGIRAGVFDPNVPTGPFAYCKPDSSYLPDLQILVGDLTLEHAWLVTAESAWSEFERRAIGGELDHLLVGRIWVPSET